DLQGALSAESRLDLLGSVLGRQKALRGCSFFVGKCGADRVPTPQPIVRTVVWLAVEGSLTSLFSTLPGRVAFARGGHYKTRSKLGTGQVLRLTRGDLSRLRSGSERAGGMSRVA